MTRSFTLLVSVLLVMVSSAQAQYSLDPTLIPPQSDSMPTWAKLLYKSLLMLLNWKRLTKNIIKLIHSRKTHIRACTNGGVLPHFRLLVQMV